MNLSMIRFLIFVQLIHLFYELEYQFYITDIFLLFSSIICPNSSVI